MEASAEASPPFGTVLVARTPQEPPSPLELRMRASSARLRVVQKLTGGAHMLLPGSDATIAIRCYFPNTLAKNDDGLVAFRNAFMYPICFFVVPPGMLQQEQLGDPHSFLSMAQLIMNNKDGTTGQQKEGSGRVFIVSDVASAISILSSIVQTLKPQRRDLKKKYHDSIKTNNFIGDSATPQVVATHTARAFSDFCTRFELPVGEDELLMSRLGSISKIGTANLSSLPIYDSTRDTVAAFFGSQQQQQRPITHGGRNRQPVMMNVGMMQESYESHDFYRDMHGSFHHRHEEPPFGSPLRDSVANAEMPNEYSQFDNFQSTMRATPQLVNQQFVPRQQGGPASSMAMANPPGPAQKPRRLLYQTNQYQMGNAIRPMSAYSSVSNS